MQRGEANFGANIDIAEKVFGDQIDSLPPSLEIDAPRLSIPLYEHRKRSSTDGGAETSRRSSKSRRSAGPSYSRCSDDAISPEFAKLMDSEFSMSRCVAKLQRLGFKDPRLFEAIDLLKVDLEAREIFMTLADENAKRICQPSPRRRRQLNLGVVAKFRSCMGRHCDDL